MVDVNLLESIISVNFRADDGFTLIKNLILVKAFLMNTQNYLLSLMSLFTNKFKKKVSVRYQTKFLLLCS